MIGELLHDYPPHDRSMLPHPPWKPDQIHNWEAAHGHDVRFDCDIQTCLSMVAAYEAAVEALQMLVAAAHGTDWAMRDVGGRCDVCYFPVSSHDDPNCGLSELKRWTQQAVDALALFAIQVTP